MKKAPAKMMKKSAAKMVKKAPVKNKIKMVKGPKGNMVPDFAVDGKGKNDMASTMKMKKAAMKMKTAGMKMVKKSAMMMKKAGAMKMMKKK